MVFNCGMMTPFNRTVNNADTWEITKCERFSKLKVEKKLYFFIRQKNFVHFIRFPYARNEWVLEPLKVKKVQGG